jgi:WD40 repeat protein
VWDLATQRKLYELGTSYFSGSIKAVALSSDDTFLAAGGTSGYLYQWKFLTSPLPAGTSLQRRTDIVPVASRIWSIQYIRDDEDLLLGVDDGGTLTYDASRVGYEGIPLVFEIPARQKPLYDVHGSNFDFTSHSVFRGDNTISINWNGAVTYQRNQIVSPMFDNLDHLDFSPDGSILAAGGKYGSTHVWNLITNEPLYKNFYKMPFGDPIAPDGSTIAIIVPASDVRVGNLYQLKKLTGAQTTVDLSTSLPNGRVGYTQDGSVFIAMDLTTSKAWDFASGIDVDVQAQDYFGCRITAPKKNIGDRLLANSAIDVFLPGDDAHMDSLCPKSFQVRNNVSTFSRDLNLLAFINANGLLEAYDVLRKVMPWPPYRLEDGFVVTGLAVSPDAAIIAVGDASGRLLFIDGRTGQLLGEIVANFGSLQAIEFSDDGTKIATAGTDGVVRIFGIVEVR